MFFTIKKVGAQNEILFFTDVFILHTHGSLPFCLHTILLCGFYHDLLFISRHFLCIHFHVLIHERKIVVKFYKIIHQDTVLAGINS